MSHEITCPECNYSNTPGSKFCNNCGAKLPLSTHILCPSCSISNTRDRVFCDHCGSRLIPITDEPDKAEQTGDSDVQEPATSSNIFALPTRKPGETGELDPSKLPDWLKREMAQQAAKPDDDSDEEIPPIEEFHSDKRQTDDLPDWLIHDSDPEPIINAPTIISTEFFMDLVGKADDLPDLDELKLDQDDDLMQESKNAVLPDWLSEADAIPELTTPAPPPQSLPEPEEIFSDIPDESFIKDLHPESTTDQDEEKPDWLTDAVPANIQDDSGVTEWLSDLEETTAETIEDKAATTDEGSGLTEWLSDLDSGELAANDEIEEFDLFTDDIREEDDDNWLNDLADSDTETAVQDAQPSSYTNSFPEPEDDDEDDWLNNLSGDQASTTAAEEPDIYTNSFPEPEDDEEDWLNNFSGDQASTTAAEEPDIYTNSFPEPEDENVHWLNNFADDPAPTTATEESETYTDSFPEPEDDDDSWWDDLSEKEDETVVSTQTEKASLLDAIPESDDDDEDSWWNDFSEEDEAATPAEPSLDALALLANPSEEVNDNTAVPEWEAVTNEQFDTLFQETTTQEADLPDWLSAAESDTDSLVSNKTEEPASENLANTQRLIENAETDWLADLEGITSEAPELSSDFLGLDEDDESLLDDLSAPLTDPEMESEPNWLSDLSAIDTGQLIIEAEADLGNFIEEEVEPEIPEPYEPLEEPSPPQAHQDDWDAEKDDDFFDLDDDDSMPDWMDQLTDAPQQSSDAQIPDVFNTLPPLASDEELPDWIASMRPDEDNVASELGGSFSGAMEQEMSDSLEGLPFDLVGGDLPDWLMQDQPGASATSSTIQDLGSPSSDENPEIPDWLKADGGSSDSQSGSDNDDNWVSMLEEVPLAAPFASTLARANIPEWVKELKPEELDENATNKRPLPEGPEETEGPLAGLRGVVAIETATIQPHTVGSVQQFLVTPEQQNQIALLQQILHEESGSGTVIATKTHGAISLALRLVLTVLLIGGIILGLRAVSLAKTSFNTVPLTVANMNSSVKQAEGLPVLVAFEYPPALSGELSPQAETLMQQLAAQNSEILTISQYPSSTAITDELGDKYNANNLGYLPGNAIGLRQLSDCLRGESACESLVGHTLPAETRQSLRNIGLIIVLTGNKDSLTNWVEQVGANDEIALSAGVTSALAPATTPYYATGQLSGYLGGMLDTAAYQNLINKDTQNVNQLLNAQLTGQLLVATLLLIGLIIYGISGSLSKRGKNKHS